MPPTASTATATTTTSTSTTAATPTTATRVTVDPTLCSAHGVCAELLAEHITLDEWGYPIIADRDIPLALLRDAKRAVANCPALALHLSAAPNR